MAGGLVWRGFEPVKPTSKYCDVDHLTISGWWKKNIQVRKFCHRVQPNWEQNLPNVLPEMSFLSHWTRFPEINNMITNVSRLESTVSIFPKIKTPMHYFLLVSNSCRVESPLGLTVYSATAEHVKDASLAFILIKVLKCYDCILCVPGYFSFAHALGERKQTWITYWSGCFEAAYSHS